MVEWNGVGLGPDTCPSKDKTAVKTEKIAREAEKPQRKTVNWGREDARPCVPSSMVMHQEPRAVVITTACLWWLLLGLFSRFPKRRVLVHV